MRDIRGYEVHEVETTSNRSKLLGAAVVAFGIGALGVYAFASGGSPTSAPQQIASNQVRTTPEGYQSQQMPPPVTPATPLDGTPLDPSPKAKPVREPAKEKPASQQAAVQPQTPIAPPAPAMTPPENAVPAQPTQPAATPDQPAPQEAPTPDTPQGQ